MARQAGRQVGRPATRQPAALADNRRARRRPPGGAPPYPGEWRQ
ncbi:hypothetical protein E2C01_085524 [Portunus trituberculatus]|uniref:Uncharacterized protein n=1 Tax=Portunus trituberculatus TaxID=210409 RepID=A0A5B7J7U6_PORTR|nr:hypothetical protein [Portunus trituberculatus]